MNIQRCILITIFLLITKIICSQNVTIVNTTDLVRISEVFGLDSALKVSKGFPIYQIDTITSKQLIIHTKNNRPSELIDEFILNYTFQTKDTKIGEVLFEYFASKEHIRKSKKSIFGDKVPLINYYVYYALSEYPIERTELFLINQYEYWNSQVNRFRNEYEKGQRYHSDKREKLQEPFRKSNQNCHTILIALEKIKSHYFDSTKLAIHKQYLICHFSPPESSSDISETMKYEMISLVGNYENIGEICFEKESNLKTMLILNSDDRCWNYLLYYKNTGYLDFGCQWGMLSGSGSKYKIELIDKNKIKLTLIYDWIS